MTPPNALILEAIARALCIRATYNRMSVLLAPHILYQKNDSFYIDAVTIERDGEPPKEEKMGAFNLAGLSEIALTDQPFLRSELYEPKDPKYGANMLFCI